MVCPRIRKARRIARHRRWRWRRRLLVPGLIAGAMCVQTVIYTRLSTHWTPDGNPDAGAPVTREVEPAPRAAFPRRLGRPVYKLSVIPGGAYSAEELRQALDSDEVAARHYAVFHRASLRTEPSRFVQPVYLSYRVGDAVFWTRRPVALARHETLLTDGANFARARCGNRVAVEPQSPEQAASPDPSVFEHAEAPPPEPSAADRDEPLLAAEVFPAFDPETAGETQQDPSDGSQLPDAGIAPTVEPTSPQTLVDQPPVPELPSVAVLWPLECRSTAPPPDALLDIPRDPQACAPLDWLRHRPPVFPPEPPPPTPVSEPGTLVLTLSALLVVAATGWRGRSAAAARRPEPAAGPATISI